MNAKKVTAKTTVVEKPSEPDVARSLAALIEVMRGTEKELQASHFDMLTENRKPHYCARINKAQELVQEGLNIYRDVRLELDPSKQG